MSQEVDLFKELLIKRGYPLNLISMDCVWVSQQKEGTARYILECVKKIEEWVNERRGK